MRMKVIFTIGYKNYNKPLFSTTKELDKPFYEVFQGHCNYFRTFLGIMNIGISMHVFLFS